MKFDKEYEMFLSTWGYKAQATMAIEEMSELTKELCKYERYGHDPEKQTEIKLHIMEEIADVLNMVEQLKFHFGQDQIEEIRQQKIERTIMRLKK